MQITGIESVEFGAPDMAEARTLFSDWGLRKAAAGGAGGLLVGRSTAYGGSSRRVLLSRMSGEVSAHSRAHAQRAPGRSAAGVWCRRHR